MVTTYTNKYEIINSASVVLSSVMLGFLKIRGCLLVTRLFLALVIAPLGKGSRIDFVAAQERRLMRV